MTPSKAFELFPDIAACFLIGNETFLSETDAKDYAKHFNLGKPQRIERGMIEKNKASEEEAAAKAEAEKAAAAEKAAQEAAAKAEAEKVAAEEKAAQEAAAKAEASKK